MLPLKAKSIQIVSGKSDPLEIKDIWDPNKVLTTIWRLEVYFDAEDPWFCPECYGNLGKREDRELSDTYDVVKDVDNSEFLAVVRGKYQRYACSAAYDSRAKRKRCTHTTVYTPPTYREHYGGKMSATPDFKRVIADLVMTDDKWDCDWLDKLLFAKYHTPSSSLVAEAVADRALELGKIEMFNPHIKTAYIVPSAYRDEPIYLLFGVIAEVDGDKGRTCVSERLKNIGPSNFTLLDVVQTTEQEALMRYLQCDMYLKHVVLTSTHEKDKHLYYTLRRRLRNSATVTRVDSYSSHNPQVRKVIPLNHLDLIKGITDIIDQMGYRNMNFLQLRVRLFRQSRYRQIHITDDKFESALRLSNRIWGEDINHSPYLQMCSVKKFSEKANNYRNSPEVQGSFRAMFPLTRYNYLLDVPFQDKYIILCSHVSPGQILADYYSDGLFCDQYLETEENYQE